MLWWLAVRVIPVPLTVMLFLCSASMAEDIKTYDNFNISFEYPSSWKVQNEAGSASLGNVTLYKQNIANEQITLSTISLSWRKASSLSNPELQANYAMLYFKSNDNFTSVNIKNSTSKVIGGINAAYRFIECTTRAGIIHTIRYAAFISPRSKRLIEVVESTIKSLDDEPAFLKIADTLHDSMANQPPTIISFKADKPSPQKTGTNIIWQAYASDPDNDALLYKFLLNGPATKGNWSELANWSSLSTLTWQAGSKDIGNNQISVWVKDNSGDEIDPGGYDVYRIAEFEVENQGHKPQLHSLRSNHPSPQTTGVSITWTASATDISSNVIYYRFWLNGPSTGRNWAPMTDWITDNTWLWNTTNADKGKNQVRVWVRDESFAGEDGYDDSMDTEFAVNDIIIPGGVKPEALNKTSTVLSSSKNSAVKVLGIDSTAFPKIRVNLFIDKFCALTGDLKQKYFTVKENNRGIAIQNINFAGNASSKKLDIAIVFDDTGSMGEEISAMKLKVQGLTDQLKRSGISARYSLVTFKDRCSIKTNWTSDPAVFKSSVNSLQAKGGDDEPEVSLDAIEAVLAMGFRPDAQKVLLVITDAHAHYKDDSSTFSKYTKEDLVRDLRESGVIFIPVTPTFKKSSAYVDLRDVAKEISGTWIDTNSADFSTILEQLQGILTGAYVIEYTSSDETPAENRDILVSVNAPDCVTDSALGNYITPGSTISANNPPTINDLKSDKKSPQNEGSIIKWTANATDLNGDEMLYRFFIDGDTATDWQTRNDWTWNASKVGSYQIEVQVRDGRHVGPEGLDDRWSERFEITKPTAGQEADPLLKVLGTQINPKKDVAFSPDGETLAVASGNGTVILWDLSTGSLIRTLKGHSSEVNSVSFSPDGRTLASGSHDNTVKLWDVSTGLLIRTLEGHSRAVTSVSFSPDGRTLTSGGGDITVKLWDVSTGLLISTLYGHSSDVNSISFSPDGHTLASGSGDKTVNLWDVSRGSLIKTLKGHSFYVYSVSFSPDGRTLASSSGDKTVKLWDVSSGSLIKTLKGHSYAVTSVSFSPDGGTLASGSGDNTVKLWNASSGSLIRTLKGHAALIYSVSFSPDGGTLASSSGDNTVKLWNASSGSLIRTLESQSTMVCAAAINTDGRLLASGSHDNTVKLWDASSGSLIRTLKGHAALIYSVSFSPDGCTLASGSGDNTVKLWNASSGSLIRTLKGHSVGVYGISFSPDGRTLASGSGDNTVKLWNASSGSLIRTLEGHTNWVHSISFSPDGRTLASGSSDKTVKLWDVSSGSLIRTLEGQLSGAYYSVSFSPDGRTLASGSGDNAVKLWDVSSGSLIRTLEGHSSEVRSVSFSPDGRTLASGGCDNTVKLWDVSSGSLIKTLKGHTYWVDSVSFSPDGSMLISSSMDGTVRLWRLE